MPTRSPIRLKSYNSSSEFFEEEKDNVENEMSIKERTANMKVKSSRVWDVKIAPGRKTQVGNHFVPKLSLGRRKPRRICVEVMKPSLHSFKASQDRTGFGADNDDGCDDVRNDFMLQLLSGNKPNTSIIECALNRDEIALMRIYKPEEKENKILRRMNHSGGSNRSVHSDDSDLDTTEKSISTIGLHGVQEIDEDRSWVESQCYSMDEIHILSRMKNIIEVQLIREKEKVNRTLIFQSPNESRSFFELVVNFQKHKQTLLRVQSEQSLEDLHENFNFDDLLIIMEVCSAWDLNIHPDDLPNMSIACVIMNKREILHETKGLSNTVEPNWTTRSGSLFLLTVPSKELKSSTSSELTFEIVAKRHSEDDMLLGSASISSNILSSSPGNRLELQLSKNNKVSGMLAIRFKIASEEDTKFMESFQPGFHPFDVLYQIKKNYDKCDIGYVPPRYERQLSSSTLSNIQEDDCPYILNFESSTSNPSSSSEIDSAADNEVFKASEKWITVGTGELGKLFLEIISCDGLEASGSESKQIDSFVSIVYEDSFVTTDIVHGGDSPRWLSKNARSFVFNMKHPSSMVNLAVHQFEESDMENSNAIGRVCINISKLSPNTEYCLTYHLHESSEVKIRRKTGCITLRVRLEIQNRARMLFTALKTPSKPIINVDHKSDFDVLQYTIKGPKREMNETILSYLEEIFLNIAWDDIKLKAVDIFFWRGTHTFFCLSVPLHSIIIFIAALGVTNFPQYIPSAIFGVLTCILINGHRINQNSFDRKHNIWYLMDQIILTYNMKRNNNEDKDVNEIQEPIDGVEVSLTTDNEIDSTLTVNNDSYLVDNKSLNSPTKSNKMERVDEDNTEKILQCLQDICQNIRKLRGVFSWEECYLSLLLAILFAILSIIFAFFSVPWFRIFSLSAKAIVWIFLGPWMWFVGYFYDNYEPNLKKLSTNTNAVSQSELEEGKESMSIKSLGQINEIDSYILSRHKDIPLGSSSASPILKANSDSVDSQMKQINTQKEFSLPNVSNILPFWTNNNSLSFNDIGSEIDIYSISSDHESTHLTKTMSETTKEPVYGSADVISL